MTIYSLRRYNLLHRIDRLNRGLTVPVLYGSGGGICKDAKRQEWGQAGCGRQAGGGVTTGFFLAVTVS